MGEAFKTVSTSVKGAKPAERQPDVQPSAEEIAKRLAKGSPEFEKAVSEIPQELLDLINRQFGASPQDLAVGVIKQQEKKRKANMPDNSVEESDFIEDEDVASELSDDD